MDIDLELPTLQKNNSKYNVSKSDTKQGLDKLPVFLKIFKILSNNKLVLVTSIGDYNDQISVIEFRVPIFLNVSISKVNQIAVNTEKVSDIAVYTNFTKQEKDMIFMIIVDENGTIRMTQLTADNYLISLPGKRILSRIPGKVVSSRIFPIANRNGTVNYAGVLNVFGSITEFNLIDIAHSKIKYSYTFEGHIKDSSGFTFSTEYSMAMMSFELNNTVKKITTIHIANRKLEEYAIKNDESVISSSKDDSKKSAVLDKGEIVVYNETDLHVRTFELGNCRVRYDIKSPSTDHNIAKICSKR